LLPEHVFASLLGRDRSRQGGEGPVPRPVPSRSWPRRQEQRRLAMARRGYTTGFGYLEPKRHVPYVTDLDGEEAETFGSTIARVAKALREASGADLVYVYIFGGGIPHLHVHRGPHRDGDALNSDIIRGELAYEALPSGAQRMVSREFPELPAETIRAVIHRTRAILKGDR
jgi:diadenosine tetraphosphate (Ap4A) HIT family hydrolase